MKNLILALSVITLLFVIGCTTDKKEKESKPLYTPDYTSLSKHNRQPDWFQDAKLVIYFHWGVYSAAAFATEWYPRKMYFEGDKVYKQHLKKYGHPSEFGYHEFVPNV